MRIGLIGFGAIGQALYNKIEADTSLETAFVFDSDKKKLKQLPGGVTLRSIGLFAERKPDLVVECASVDALKQYAELVLGKTDLLALSVCALADKSVEGKIAAACEKSGSEFFVPSGAIVGLDGIRAVRGRLERVQLITRKNPKGFGRSNKVKKVLFDGSAREACRLFPRNVNVAATLSLNGIGFDKTMVKIISDPYCDANTHTVAAEGDFGKFELRVEAVPSSNPRTSGFVVDSAFSAIKQIEGGINLF